MSGSKKQPSLTEQELFYLLVKNKKLKRKLISGKLISSLIEKGLLVEEESGYVFLKQDIIPLRRNLIEQHLSGSVLGQLQGLEIVYETQSTNKLIQDYVEQDGYSLLLAEYQNRGQGRRTRLWQSPLAANIYLSLAFNIRDGHFLNFLPLITALSVCESLQKIPVKGLQIKWPNDIYLNGKKLGGILIEAVHRAKASTIICGIGLNINMTMNDNIDQLWTSLSNETGIFLDRNVIIAHLVNELINTFNSINDFNYKQFTQQWMRYDYLHNKQVLVTEDAEPYPAQVKGLSRDGALLVECVRNDQLVTRTLYAADVSVKPETNH